MYTHVEFPKYLYHKTNEPKIVNSKEEQKELGEEWAEVPFEDETEVHAEEKPKKKTK